MRASVWSYCVIFTATASMCVNGDKSVITMLQAIIASYSFSLVVTVNI